MSEEDKKKLLYALRIGMVTKETTLVLDQNQCKFLYEKLESILKED